MRLETIPDGFVIHSGDAVLLAHTETAPAITVGIGEALINAERGHFAFDETITRREILRHAVVNSGEICLSASADTPALLVLRVEDGAIALKSLDPALNRLSIELAAQPDEAIWGCGEQMSYLNLRGRNFPLWTSEPGIGRDPARLGLQDTAFSPLIGDYWTTYFPQPTYISSQGYALHIDSTAYAEFDFRSTDRHRLTIWEIPQRIELFEAPSPEAITRQLSNRFGPQPRLPDWAISGAIIGLKDGQNGLARLDAMIDAGVNISAIWCEDWAGIRETGFGRRLFWDWQRNEARYPDLPQTIARLRQRGIGFMGYVNPYLCVDGSLFAEAEKAGHFIRNRDGETYLTDFGEFICGQIDLTNEAACDWFADRIIGREMLDIGMSGWMADFGEYLPVDAVLADGSDPMLAHNRWPVLWARLNAKAIERHDNGSEPVFFMRSGHSGVVRYCPLIWAGDQSVDFSRHDGIGTAICAALSAGLVGAGNHHSDIGGYTSIGNTVRTPELLMRWAELAAFTPVMRTHEGNRPDDNLQADSTPKILAHFAAMTRIHAALAPYVTAVQNAADGGGLPLQRALFLHFPADPVCRDIQDQYLYGPDLLVAPVIEEGARERRVYLPGHEGGWVHIWSGETYDTAGWHTVTAPIGQPPVFYRTGAAMAALLSRLPAMKDPA